MKPNIQRKIIKEVKEINDESEHINIYALLDEEFNLSVMMIGPSDSPYHGGFFLFKVKFTEDYPFSPPRISFITPQFHKNCRLHPNLYQEGKVCLSILNTWDKNEWSPILTLEKIFLTIQGLLNDNPIINEPRYEDRVLGTHQEAKDYYTVALYRTLTVAVLGMLSHPSCPPQFMTIIRKYMADNKSVYLDQISRLEAYDKQRVKCIHGEELIDLSSLGGQLSP